MSVSGGPKGEERGQSQGRGPGAELTWHEQLPSPSMPSAQLPRPLQGAFAPPGHSKESEDPDVFIRDYPPALGTYCVPVNALSAGDQEKWNTLLASPRVS